MDHIGKMSWNVRFSIPEKGKTLSFYNSSTFTHGVRGTRWRSWLRHCATRRKVAGSIPDGVIGIFHLHNPSGRTVALEVTHSLTEMSTRNISWW